MKVYEGMFLLKAGEAAADSQIDVVKGIIEKRKGVIREIRKWDERKLAYDIGKNKRGLYVLSYFEGPPEAIDQIRRDCSLSEEVIRVLIVTAEKYKKAEEVLPEPQKKELQEGAAPEAPPQKATSDSGVPHETNETG